jgi:hypothetical protein
MWDPFDWLAIRGSFGTNYATPPNITPGDVSAGLSLIQNAGNKYLRVETENLAGLKPEGAKATPPVVTIERRSPCPRTARRWWSTG